MSIISTEIDFNQLSKSWLDEIPKICKYDDLVFEYNNTNYDNSVLMEKNIHFIWIGSLIKEKYLNTVLQCKIINVNYSIILWVDNESLNEDILQILISNNIFVKNVYDDLTKDGKLDKNILKQYNKFGNFGFKADILRLYIVYKYGGIYSDIDSVWLKPFDDNFDYDFVSYRIDNQCAAIGNPFFGFCKNSIILLDFLQNLEKSIDCIMKIDNHSIIQAHIPIMTGAGFITKILMENNYKNLHYIHQAYCVIGGPHEEIYSSFSKEGRSYCYQTFDKNWC